MLTLTRSVMVTFKSPLHRTETRFRVQGTDLDGYDYQLSQDQLDALHARLCGCGYPPNCQLWQVVEHDLDGYIFHANGLMVPHG